MMPRQEIVIAETQSENIETLQRILSNEPVTVVERGEQLLEKILAETAPALILISASLPDMDACDLCRRLKASDATSEVPVLFLLSSEESEKPDRFFDAGGADFLSTPLYPETTRARLSAYLKLGSCSRELEDMRRRCRPEHLDGEQQDKESLRAYVKRLQAVIEMAGEGVTLSDEQGYFEFYNQRMQEMTGYSRAEANASDDFLALLHPELSERYAALLAMHEIKSSGSSKHLETTIHTKDGTIKTLLVSTSSLIDRGRLWFLSIYHDITGRKTMERALRESEERFRSFAEHSLDVIMRFDREHRHLYVNPAVEKQTGIAPKEFIGKTHAELGFPEELVHFWDKTIEEVFVSGTPQRTEFELLDGFWIDWMLIPEYSAFGEVETVITTARDITSLKQAEEELRQSRALFRSAFEKSGVGMVLVDIESMCTLEVNSAFCADLGYACDEIKGRSVFELTHPEDRDIGRLEIQEVREGKRETFQVEKRFLHKNGANVWTLVSAAIVHDRQGRPSYFVTHLQNITERKLAEEQAQQQRRIAESLREVALVLNSSLERDTVLHKILKQLGTVFRCDSAAIFLPDGDELVIVEAMGKAETSAGGRVDMKGDDPAASIMRRKRVHIIPDVQLGPDWKFWPGEAGAHIKSWMGAPLLIGEQAIGVLTADSIQPNRYTEEDARILLSFANHAALAIYNARLFDDALQAREIAEVANKAKSEFLGRVSHELRTPLHIIMGMTFVVQTGELTPKQRRSLEKAQKASEKLLRLINEMLDFSNMETGKLRIESRPFRLDLLLKTLFERHAKLVRQEEVRVELCLGKTLPYALIGDSQHLDHVLENLLDNAVKFTPAGEILLKVSRVESCENTADRVTLHFSLTDTGIGIAPEQLSGIFAPFHQVDGSSTRKYGGTGLGLALCKRLVEMMGGGIRIESTPGKGSTVSFTLPFDVLKSSEVFIRAETACQTQSGNDVQDVYTPKLGKGEEKAQISGNEPLKNTPELNRLFLRVTKFLEEGNMEMEECFAALKSSLPGRPFDEILREIQSSIRQYDFEKALETLHNLMGMFE